MQDSYNPYMQGGGSLFGSGIGQLGALGAAYFMKNPSDSAMRYYDQLPEIYQQYYNPYITAGEGAMSNLQGQYNNLTHNPTQIMNQIGATYHSSPAYQWQLKQNLQATNQASAAGGMAGSPQNQQYGAQLANNMANQDYYHYLDQGEQMYGMGLEGEQRLNQQGFNASNELAQSLGNTYMNMGNLAYTGQQSQNNLWEYALGSL